MHRKPSDIIADQIRKRRGQLGLNREQLAQECAKLGAPELTYAALTNIETGRRTKEGQRRRDVTVEELLVLAHVLATPPLLLLFPLGTEDEVLLPPNWRGRHPHAAWKWAVGEDEPGFTGEDGRPYADFSEIGETRQWRQEVWERAALPAKLYNGLQPAQDRFRREANRYLHSEAAYGADSPAAKTSWEARQSALQEFARALNDLISAGFKPPAYTEDWHNELISTGLIARPDALPVFRPGESTPKEAGDEQ
ncbi:helix-turn-helix domain-containing protein [Nocardiopsis kunsanensis]|uniref:helix-turn-helix domain-containing protein n=1 Tax=Nocardiopsis kunsanensis TaxID=141693 RepID=UPI000375012E|nr:helix-turn-helix transcriptional regulator [Nocardiopsis kunsanensis]